MYDYDERPFEAEFTTGDSFVKVSMYETEGEHNSAYLCMQMSYDDDRRHTAWVPLHKMEWAIRALKAHSASSPAHVTGDAD